MAAWLAPVSASGQPPAPARLPVLSTVSAIRALSQDEGARGYPVQVRATVTHVDELGQVVDVACLAGHMQVGRLVRPRDADLRLAVRAGQICGTVTCWWASEGVNFSFIENATDDLVIDQAMPADVRTTIARELLTSSMNHYQSRGRPYAVGLVDVESARLDQGIASLPRTSKKYARLCVEHSCFPAAREYFERHYSRLLLQRSDFDESDGGGEFGGPGE